MKTINGKVQHEDKRGRSYETAQTNSQYVAEVIAEVRFENDNEDEVIQYFEDNCFWSDDADPLKSLVWVQSNDAYGPEQDWNVRVHGLVWYDTAVQMLSDSSTRLTFMMEGPDACYEASHGSMSHIVNLR